jgi:hypothetical protein
MPAPLFEFFEVIADELSAAPPSTVITPDSLRPKEKGSVLLEQLTRQMKASDADDAIERAVNALEKHFRSKDSKLPFDYDARTGLFTVTDLDFLGFVKEMSSIRSINKRSRDFECTVAEWLGKRATGAIHRVGHPRDTKKKSKEFNKHLRTLGFKNPVLLGREKDGGLDIIWLLPLGTLPHRPLVLVQCKNGEFKMEAADISLGAATRSLSQHGCLQASVHVPCVLFNDYLYPDILTAKQMNYIPLGLSDLAAMQTKVSVQLI